MFNKLYIRFNISTYNQYCIIENSDLLEFIPSKTHEFNFKFLPNINGKLLFYQMITISKNNLKTSNIN